MTKTEILKKIENNVETQKDAVKVVNEVLKSVPMSDDAAVLGAVLHTMNGCMCDTMNTLALILCEMLPEKETEKAPEPTPEKHTRGKHCDECVNGIFPHCSCITCARDHGHTEDERGCCMEHNKMCYMNCPDYVKEDPDA